MDGWEGELCRGVGFSGLALSPLGHWSLRSGPSAPRDISTTIHQHVLFSIFYNSYEMIFYVLCSCLTPTFPSPHGRVASGVRGCVPRAGQVPPVFFSSRDWRIPGQVMSP